MNAATRSPWKRRIRRSALSAVGVLVGCAVLGFSVQSVATWKARRDFPPPGRLVDVGGYRLHLDCRGDRGNPTVVLESGFAGWSIDWVDLQPRLSTEFRVCSYDRAGFGWSDPGPSAEAGAPAISSALHRLLQDAGERGPYVVVAHSLGGIYARQFAHRFPDDTAGLVLLDSSHEDVVNRLPREAVQEQLDQLRVLRFARYLTPFGVQRLVRQPLANVDDETPEATRAAGVALGYRADSYFAAYDQVNRLLAASRRGDLPVPSIPAVPLVVLSSGGAVEEFGSVWRTLQHELAQLSPRNREVFLPASGHDIQRDAPDAVIDAVRDVVSGDV